MAECTTTTKAIVTSLPKEGPQLSWALQPVKIRGPNEDEVLVRVLATGICHTDLVLSMVPPEMSLYPKVLGHEGGGIVEKVGSKITHVKPGDYVLLSFDFCGQEACHSCSSGTPGYCQEFVMKNFALQPGVYETDGGEKVAGAYFGQSTFAGLALVKEKSTLNVSDLVKNEEELKMFSPFGCGFQTGAGAVTELADVKEKDAVAVSGLGGVGMSAIMAAKVRGAHTIIGIDRVQSRLDIAKSLGATHVINTSDFKDLAEDLTKAIKDVSAAGVNVNIDTTGVTDIVRAGVQSLHGGGQQICLGIMTGQSLDIDLGDLLMNGKSIRGCIEGNAMPEKFVPQMIQWYREGKFPIEKLIKYYPAEDFEKALGEMHSGATIKPILTW